MVCTLCQQLVDPDDCLLTKLKEIVCVTCIDQKELEDPLTVPIVALRVRG
jgi:hypothetical protein